ncbi:MAG TPA: hypothetical protein VHP11_01615 [Tepidisphaeraceae bacterium]|nr:hypothetical protein [Tepidisphaeraceae bacterium]
MSTACVSPSHIAQWVDEAVGSTPVYDLHTHLYPAGFGKLMLWGIDELLTYHYLIAETLRVSELSYEAFWRMGQKQQAEHVWQMLFVERSPVSEACRGVLTVLNKLGVDVATKDLGKIRAFFHARKPAEYVDQVLKVANVRGVVMTNDALDPLERELWLKGVERDPRFKAVLRIDPLLLGWPKVGDLLSDYGYAASADLGGGTMKEIRRFLEEWIQRMGALYVAVSLPPTWRYPDASATTKVLDEAVLPVARERNLPVAMMIGVTRQVNPRLRMAGDSLGQSDIASVERICANNPQNKFMVTMLSRENQHELAVTARKQRNMMVFGCWWFLNNPSLIEETTRMRMELLGTSFVPQHSDARVMDQLIYKWEHSRRIIAKVMKEKFGDLAATGWPVTCDEVKRTVEGYLGGNFEGFLGR